MHRMGPEPKGRDVALPDLGEEYPIYRCPRIRI
jgi:hypothetical protein